MGVSNPINVGSETVTPTLNLHNNCGEFKSHKALTEMGISHPIKHAQINVGESLHHTAPMEVNLINVPLNTGSETATPTFHRRNNCGEIKSHTAQTNMGISVPINTSFAMADPTNHGHTTDGRLTTPHGT